MKKFSIPVTWEMYGRVIVEANSKEEALEEFHRIEDTGFGFDLPDESYYVDDSFQLSDDNTEELLDMIEEEEEN